MNDDKLKNRILSRRAKFVAAAIAAGSLGATDACSPQPCLDIATPPVDASKDGPDDATNDAPQVCLTAPFDAGSDATDGSTDGSDGSSDANEGGNG